MLLTLLVGIGVYVVVDAQGDRAAAQSITRETKGAAPAAVAKGAFGLHAAPTLECPGKA